MAHEDGTREPLGGVVFSAVSSEDVTMPFPFESTEAFLRFWSGAKNPAAAKVMSNWHGDIEEAKKAVGRVASEEYGGGREIKTWAVLAMGRK